MKLINDYLPYYGSVHRGNGFKSLMSTHLFEAAREAIMELVHANEKDHVCIFTRNTTESINRLSRRFHYTKERFVVITTEIEHNSNDLPYRENAPKVIHANVFKDGKFNYDDLYAKINEYGKNLAFVAVSAASHVTGDILPVHEIARKTHEVGGQIFVDCAQLISRREIDIKPLSDPEHLDYIAFSGHLLYAPFGTGALVGRRDTFEEGAPDFQGGGAVELVSLTEVLWAPPPDREEAGSPNIPGSVAILAAIRQLQLVGINNIAEHENALHAYALQKLASVPGIRFFHDANPSNASNRIGILTFTISTVSQTKVAAILGYEYGIGVRAGCLCAHPLIAKLLDLPDNFWSDYREQLEKCNCVDKPGVIRCSLGLFNTMKDIDALHSALMKISTGQFKGQYSLQENGEYIPKGWDSKIYQEHLSVLKSVIKVDQAALRLSTASNSPTKTPASSPLRIDTSSPNQLQPPKSPELTRISIASAAEESSPKTADTSSSKKSFWEKLGFGRKAKEANHVQVHPAEGDVMTDAPSKPSAVPRPSKELPSYGDLLAELAASPTKPALSTTSSNQEMDNLISELK